MVPDIIWVEYEEFSKASVESRHLPSLRDNIHAEAQEHEDEIARYLEIAPSYSGMGTIVGDVLNPNAQVILFPGRRTDGVFVWPAELSYYVRRYHLRVPDLLVERMASLNWQPPTEEDIDWQRLGMPNG